MDFNKLTPGEKVVVVAGTLLVVDLLFLPWHDLIVLRHRTGVQSPHAFWGVMALLLAVAMVAGVLVSRVSAARLPDLPWPRGQAVFGAGVAVAALLALKLVIETSLLGIGAWLGVLLGGAMAYGGFLVRQEEAALGP